MKRHPSNARKQSGIALIALLVLLILAGSYAFYRSLNIGLGTKERDAALVVTLAKAKESLIAYAVMDSKRPGRLLCPDLLGDGVSPLLSRDDCDAYTGWLPWKTLDLKDTTDDHGTSLRYVALRWFAGDRANPPLNSDTLSVSQLAVAGIPKSSLESISLGTLYVDIPVGNGTDAINPTVDPKNDIVALIIAPRGELDSRNADGDNYFFSGKSSSDPDNDVIMPVTRQELMAAIEKRIANELRTCLEQHAANTIENPAQTYPWPAPLANDIFKGTAKSLFGMVPATQPGSSPDETLKKSIGELNNAKLALESASTATAQLAAVQQIQDAAAYSRALFDRLYIVAADLVTKASTASSMFNSVDAALSPVLANSTAFKTGSSTIPAAIASALPTLDALQESLANSGFDPFLHELEMQNSTLISLINVAVASPTAKNFGALQTQANFLKRETLGSVYTPNSTLANLLAQALGAAVTAVADAKAAKALPTDTTLAAVAITSATALSAANQQLAQTIKASRLSLDPAEVSYATDLSKSALIAFTTTPTPETVSALLSTLESANTLLNPMMSGPVAVLAARSTAQSALQTSIGTAKAGNDPTLIQSTSTSAMTSLSNLVTLMENNGDNVLIETLKIITTQLQDGAKTPPATLTAGNQLLATVNDIKSWSDIVSAYAQDIAQKARKGTTAVGDSDSSAYTAARQLLSSIDGSTGTMEKLEAYIKSPTDTSKQSAAVTALAETQTLLTKTISTANQLDTLVESSLAQAATPTRWYGKSCAFLKPSTGSDTWWTTSEWAKFFFYQLSDHVRPATGKLVVNGDKTHTYRVVVISAGRALGTQNRTTRTTGNFLEGINADVSRNDDATNPKPAFASHRVAAFPGVPEDPTIPFNDRLAY